MKFYLYRIILPDGRAYIGAAKNPKVRFVEHCRGNFFVGEAIRQVGKEHAVFQILACGERNYIFELEEKAIAAFHTRWPNGLNLAAGGFGGRDPLPSTRLKVSLARLGQKKSEETKARMSRAQLGKTQSAETRAKLADINRGKNMPQEIRKRISMALIGKPKSPEFNERLRLVNLGKRHTMESRRKMSQAKRGRPWSRARRAAYDPIKAAIAQKKATAALRSLETKIRLSEARKNQLRINSRWATAGK